MSELVLEFYKCPKCERPLKPSIVEGEFQTTISQAWDGKITKVETPDLLVCRYCKIKVRVSLLRKQKNPSQFIANFKKMPMGFSMSADTIEKIQLREDHEENLRKYKHTPRPNKCPNCKSEDIVAECGDYGWNCISCDEYFEWKSYRIMFHGDVELESDSEDNAREYGYVLLEKGVLDIDAEVDLIR